MPQGGAFYSLHLVSSRVGSELGIPGNTYSTTSNKGDYSDWEVVNDTGGIDYTYGLAARCGSANADTIHNL